MARRSWNKLVRDKIPDYLAARGIASQTRKLDDDEYYQELRKKLQEEVAEYLEAETPESRCEERADICEVLAALAMFEDGDMDQVEEVKEKKLQERGGFFHRIFLIETNE